MVKPLMKAAPNPKMIMFLVSTYSCPCRIHWSQVLSRTRRCTWSSADRCCSNYIWVINSFIAYWGVTYIRCIAVYTSDNIYIYWFPCKRILPITSRLTYVDFRFHVTNVLLVWLGNLCVLPSLGNYINMPNMMEWPRLAPYKPTTYCSNMLPNIARQYITISNTPGREYRRE